MNERDVIIRIAVKVGRGTAHPRSLGWRIRARADEAAEDVQRALTLVCRELCAEVREMVQ